MNLTNTRTISLLSVCLGAALACSNVHAQNLLVNGNFGTGDLTGWTVTNAFAGVSSFPGRGVGVAVAANYGGTLSQTFSTITGNTYRIQYYSWGEQFQGNYHRLDVNGTTLWSGFLVTAPSAFAFDTQFQATGSLTTLNLNFQTVPGYGAIWFSDVRVTDVTVVPAPAALPLMAGGLATGALRRRRR
ncbi:MAG: PEP-CTERM sorting domain-containing protein [Phycisphaerales bacterium]|nr:PEP-CTERM sorting domain-containing protein [Phycisphaerales bacterium]